jgi:hypothetical protein
VWLGSRPLEPELQEPLDQPRGGSRWIRCCGGVRARGSGGCGSAGSAVRRAGAVDVRLLLTGSAVVGLLGPAVGGRSSPTVRVLTDRTLTLRTRTSGRTPIPKCVSPARWKPGVSDQACRHRVLASPRGSAEGACSTLQRLGQERRVRPPRSVSSSGGCAMFLWSRRSPTLTHAPHSAVPRRRPSPKVERAKEAWLRSAREAGKPIPGPRYKPAVR